MLPNEWHHYCSQSSADLGQSAQHPEALSKDRVDGTDARIEGICAHHILFAKAWKEREDVEKHIARKMGQDRTRRDDDFVMDAEVVEVGEPEAFARRALSVRVVGEHGYASSVCWSARCTASTVGTDCAVLSD